MVILVIVLLGVLISFVQTYRSEQAIRRLRETGDIDGDGSARRQLDGGSAARNRAGGSGAHFRGRSDSRGWRIARSARPLCATGGADRRVDARGKIGESRREPAGKGRAITESRVSRHVGGQWDRHSRDCQDWTRTQNSERSPSGWRCVRKKPNSSAACGGSAS